MKEEIHFTKFKLIKDKKYRFKSKKQKELYFAYLTLNKGVDDYKREHKDFLFNKLNVYFSWSLLLKYLPLGMIPFMLYFMGVGYILVSQILFSIFLTSLVALPIVNFFSKKFYKKYSFTKFLIDQIDDYENERQLSQEVINDYKIKKNKPPNSC